MLDQDAVEEFGVAAAEPVEAADDATVVQPERETLEQPEDVVVVMGLARGKDQFHVDGDGGYALEYNGEAFQGPAGVVGHADDPGLPGAGDGRVGRPDPGFLAEAADAGLVLVGVQVGADDQEREDLHLAPAGLAVVLVVHDVLFCGKL